MAGSYPSDWDSRRKDVYQRDDYACQNCGAPGGPRGHAELHAHHIVPISNGGTHKRSNLKTMCSECHKAIHGDVMAPSPEEIIQGNTESIRVTNAEELVSLVGEAIELYRQLRSHPILDDGAKTHIDDSIDEDLLEEITIKREILSEYTDLSYNSTKRQDAVDELSQVTAQHLYLMTDVWACLSEFYDVANQTKCPNCKSDQSVRADYCAECGSELPTIWTCPSCNRDINTWQNEFCTHCGADLPSVPPEHARKLETTIENIETAVEQADEKSREISDAFDRVRQVF